MAYLSFQRKQESMAWMATCGDGVRQVPSGDAEPGSKSRWSAPLGKRR